MKKVFQIFGVVFIIFLVIFILVSKVEYGKDSVRQWARKNQYEIVNIETHMTIFGTPYNWLNKGQNIFEVEIKTKEGISEKWWVRTGAFTDDYEKENKNSFGK
jgi:hypothetical protein